MASSINFIWKIWIIETIKTSFGNNVQFLLTDG